MRAVRVAAGAAVVGFVSLLAVAQQRDVSRATSPNFSASDRGPILVVRDGAGSPTDVDVDVSGAIGTVDAAGAPASVFSSKEAVFLATGSVAEPCRDVEAIAPGDYVFAVTDATGERLLSTEPASQRIVTVGEDGALSAGGPLHPSGGATACGSGSIQLAPFADAGDDQAGYIVWLTPVAAFEGELSSVDPACGAGCFHGFRPESSRTFAFRVEDKHSCEPTFCVSGVKFEDVNGNGVRDSGEPGLAGVEVRVTGENGVVLSALSGPDGAFRVCGLLSGATSRVSEVVPFGFQQTGPLDHRPSQHLIARDLEWIVVSCQGDFSGVDFANQRLASGSIGGVKFEDLNANGVRDAGEPGLEGVTIILASSGPGAPSPAATITDAAGNFLFSDVAPGSYVLSETVPPGFVQTAPPPPGTIAITLEPGGSSLENVFGNAPARVSGTISGLKFNDANGNGVRDGDEGGLPGVTITLTGPADFEPRTAVTGADGSFSFTDLRFATYTLAETVPAGFAQTAPPPPGTFTITLSPTQPDSANNLFGNRSLGPVGGTGSISGTKIFDMNGNGIVDGVDHPLEGVVFVLTDSSGFERRVTSAADGTFTFTDLPEGTYVLSEILPENFFQTFPGSQAAPGTYTITLTAGEARTGILFLNKC